MPLDSAYYDTCVFGEALNPGHAEHAACQRLLDVRTISWWIGFCAELTFSEATIQEYVQQFEIACISNGVDIRRVKLSDAKAKARRNLGLKKRLRLLGFESDDWNHLMAALHSAAASLCTVDLDFWDPANKATPAAAAIGTRVRVEIENSLPLVIRLPSEFLAAH